MKYSFDLTQGDINVVIKSLRRYNRKGLKRLFFTIFPLLREGDFNNNFIEQNKFYIPFDKTFEFIYGKTFIDFKIIGHTIEFDLNDKVKYLFFSLYRSNIQIIDGIPIIDDISMFKFKTYKNILNTKSN